MAKRKTKKYKQLKKMHMCPRFAVGLLAFAVSIMCVDLGIIGFLLYITDTKLGSENDRVNEFAKVCESVMKSDTEDESSLLHGFDNTFTIKDKRNVPIVSNGNITIGDNAGILSLPSGDMVLFTDKEYPIVYVKSDGEVAIDILELAKMIPEISEKLANYSRSSAFFEIPVWIEKDLNACEAKLFCKIFLSFSFSEIAYFLIFAIATAALVFIPFILLLINLLISFIEQKKIKKILFGDIVTKAHNYTWFLFKAEKLLEKKHKFKYAILDVVFVKYRNYCMCHSVAEGEKMLKKVDGTINDKLAKGEMCAHFASANFVVLLKYADEDNLKARIENIIESLEKTDTTHNFSFHVGIRTIDANVNLKKSDRRAAADVDKYYNDACAARSMLADSDDSGIMFFSETILEEQKWVDVVIEKIDEAIAAEEFVIYYQPKYNPETEELKGAEALIRWDSKEYGFLSPGKFIPILEKNGYITTIDHYMLSHVAKQQAMWLNAGKKCVPISVNVSRAHFIENDLAKQIIDIMDEEGTPHDLIEIELTESAFFDDKKALLSTIGQLREAGFMVSMDDFGSGYSSLNSLKDLPLDVLKLDAEFFRGESENGRGEIVISEAIKLAKSLSMETVAEGIEKKEHVDFLKKMGCDMIQGYYFAKPMPSEEFEKKM